MVVGANTLKDVVIVIQQTMVCVIVTNYKRKWVDQVVDQELEEKKSRGTAPGISSGGSGDSSSK